MEKNRLELVRSTLRHVTFAVRALLFARIDPAQQRAIGPEPVIVAFGAMAAEVALGASKVDDVALSAVGVSATLAHYAVLVGCLLVLGAPRRNVDIGSLVTVILAMGLIGLIITTSSGWVDEPLRQLVGMSRMNWAWFALAGSIVWLAWYCAALGTYASRSTGSRSRGFGFGVVAALLAASWVLPSTPIVVEASEESEGLLQAGFERIRFKRRAKPVAEPRAHLNVEAIYARQPELIDAAFDSLPPSRADRREIYFVGMAPYAEQDVFKRELESARSIVEARFATGGRSLLMINHRDTTETVPLAGATNLERVLWRLAQVMDPAKDVLVLYITTHGSEGLLSVTFPRFSLADLTPDHLVAILNRTGIRNRVIILSACHSGSFVSALEGPDTLVMAAARTDRASFGCSNERDWTYFGDALFNHALRETHSFVDAFTKATALVGDWERAQKLEPPSLPQMSVGAEIAPKLADIAQRLKAGPSPFPAFERAE